MKINKLIGIIYNSLLYSDIRIKYMVKILIWLKKTKKSKLLRYYLREHLRKKYHVIIAEKAVIGGINLPHPHNVVIGQDVHIGENCTLYHDVTIGQNKGRFPCFGDNVIVYTGAKVFGGISVGNNVIIGANSVVTHDVPDNAIVAGNPAKIIRYRKEDDEFY